jgi:hypothetical protein
VFILYMVIALLKIKETSIWIHDLLIPSLVTDRLLSDFIGFRLDLICSFV